MHLCLGKHLEELLVLVTPVVRVSVGTAARALVVLASAPAYSGEELGTVCVCLGPLGEYGGAVTCRPIHTNLSLLGPAVTGILNLLLVREVDLVLVEDDILVDIENHIVVARHQALPVLEAHEAITKYYESFDAVLAHNLVCIFCPLNDVGCLEAGHPRLVGETVMADDVLVAGLREELGQTIMNVKCALGVLRTIFPVQPANRSPSAAVVPSILTTGNTVQI
ncbi:hypothetical protein HG530_002261 [Fusarium avenaceum]|nr:hypothetical protein HG530_002261 [Fusarium avenaceum]